MSSPSPWLNAEDFDGLYDQVTADLRRFLVDESAANLLATTERAWFEQLIVDFRLAFLDWPRATGAIRQYLELFEQPKTDRYLHLAAHAFLHVAYDLPRIISRTLPAPGQDRTAMRRAFLRPGTVFMQSFLKHARTGRLGWRGWLAGRVDAAGVLAYWVLVLRSIAWIHAESIADMGGPFAIEHRMARELYLAGKKAADRHSIMGVLDLDNRELMQVVPVAGVSAGSAASGVVGAIIGASVAAVTLTLLASRRTRDQQRARQIELLGALVHAAMVRAFDPQEGSSSEPTGR